MTATRETSPTAFTVDGTRCAAWITLPDRPGPHPAVVLVHGLGATHDMMLSQYEHHFATAGIATLAFDYRHTGASGGSPRQRISMRRHRADVHAALDYLRARDDIDANRIGLWGTSLGAMHALRVAAACHDLAAVVVQCPIVYGPAAAARSGPRAVARLSPAVIADAARILLGRKRRYVPIVAAPGATAVVTVPGALDGWNSTTPPGALFDNRIAAANALGLATVTATRHARRITAPLLVCVSDNETLMDPRHAALVAARAPRAAPPATTPPTTSRSTTRPCSPPCWPTRPTS
ncbi:alpha/beta fold hydrolase [Micromonospora vinacea]|uniref:alpha/beta hydrolase n=1 Tax=Micromonospora vinacea TaxID=709878 RepID=UPI0034563763